MTKRLLIAGIAFILMSRSAYAESETGMNFFRHDWEIVCDNTRTCRAAGYQRDEDELAVSVLLTRAAGPGRSVEARLMIGHYDDEALPNRSDDPFEVVMTVNGKGYGSVWIGRRDFIGDLSDEQTAALASSLAGHSVIEFTAEKSVWRLSDNGAAAVLLKMDDYQGRVGTKSALIKKGDLGEENVLPALPMPAIVAAEVVDRALGDGMLSAVESEALRNDFRATATEDDCPMIFESESNESRISIARLNGKKLLASVLCWRAAYNEGYGYWVIDDNRPYSPVSVTNIGSGYSNGVIVSEQKGRGLGDCRSRQEWIWDGRQFVPTASSTGGMCKLVAPGGAWELPVNVSEIRSPRAR